MITKQIILCFLKSLKGSYVESITEVVSFDLNLAIDHFIHVKFKVINTDNIYFIKISFKDIKDYISKQRDQLIMIILND